MNGINVNKYTVSYAILNLDFHNASPVRSTIMSIMDIVMISIFIYENSS